MVGWHHQLNGHEPEQIPGDSEGQGSLAYCSPQGCKELDMTEQLNNKYIKMHFSHQVLGRNSLILLQDHLIPPKLGQLA